MSTEPLLSVVIPTYNRARTLHDCLASIAKQLDFNDFEIVVVDNASEQKVQNERVINEFKNALSKRNVDLRYHYNEENLWVVQNKHLGVQLAKGKYVVISDDDDFYLNPYFFAKAMQALNENPDVSVLLSQVVQVYDDNSETWATSLMQEYQNKKHDMQFEKVDGDKYFTSFWTRFHPRQCNTSIALRSVINKVNWYDYQCNDQSFHLLAAPGHKVLLSDNVVAAYRKHNNPEYKANETTYAQAFRCVESHTVIDDWTRFGKTHFKAKWRFNPLIWRLKNMILKDTGVIRWLSDPRNGSLSEFYQLLKQYRFFNYFIVRYLSLAQLRIEKQQLDQEGWTILAFCMYKIRRFFAILILRTDRLVH